MPADHRRELADIRRFDQLVAYLRDHMGWPIQRSAFEDVDDLFYDFTAEELGIDPKTAVKIEEIKRLRPLAVNQPFGVFFVKFAPKRLPVVALRRILSQVALKKRASANSAERAAWAADDLLFISNYGAGEERRICLAHFVEDREVGNLAALKVLGWDGQDTGLHLDDVAEKLTRDLAWPDDQDDVAAWRDRWRSAFTLRHHQVITTAKALALQLATLARDIRVTLRGALNIETERGKLRRLMAAFRQTLLHDLDDDGFADMYAQTVAYGLLSARVSRPGGLVAEDVALLIPETNPFLREMLETFLHVGGRMRRKRGPALDFDELGVNEVVETLRDADMEAVLRDFGDRNPREDPVIHFYELFLKEYDAKKRMQRGVFYTPQPVVSYIVRSVHELLQTEFGLEDGLASTVTWGEMAKRFPPLPPGEGRGEGTPGLTIPEGAKPTDRFVTILDPAVGTATFLVEVIDIIHKTMVTKWKKQGHMDLELPRLWNDYVPKHLLPRLHGYELLMAPYAIAHMKIGLKLHETGYRFESDERARIYLTNSLEPATDGKKQMEFKEWIPALAHEAQAVNEIKRRQRFTVVIGNPPYANFGQQNRIPLILTLLEDYKRGLNERKLNLDDDFIKFIRFGQSLIEDSRTGVLSFISNSTYIDGITHRQMRRALSLAFHKIDVLDLHGSHLKADRAPDGNRDENVFDIQQGVAIGLFLRLPNRADERIGHAGLSGVREQKYEYLANHTAGSTTWTNISLIGPSFFFVPKNFIGQEEYQRFASLPELMPSGTSAIQTKCDALFVDFDARALAERMKEILANGPTAKMAERYPLGESAGWSPSCLRGVQFDAKSIRPYLYRPFDRRSIYYDDALLGRSRIAVFRHLLKPNLAIATLRQTVDDGFRHVLCTAGLCDINLTIGHHVSDQVFPLYLYGDGQQRTLGLERTPNFSEPFVLRFASTLGLRWTEDGRGDLQRTVGPEDMFDFLYAVLHSPGYRTRYAELLKIDFPRLPLTSSLDLFRELARLGGELVAFHLVEGPAQQALSVRYDKAAKSWRYEVAKGQRLPVTLSFKGPEKPVVGKVGWSDDTVWIDAVKPKKGAADAKVTGTVGFRGVPEEVWNFHIGGYQVCEKWLKDRKDRTLTKDDLAHYQKIVIALAETIRLMAEIDRVIDQHGGWPNAFAKNDASGKT